MVRVIGLRSDIARDYGISDGDVTISQDAATINFSIITRDGGINDGECCIKVTADGAAISGCRIARDCGIEYGESARILDAAAVDSGIARNNGSGDCKGTSVIKGATIVRGLSPGNSYAGDGEIATRSDAENAKITVVFIVIATDDQ